MLADFRKKFQGFGKMGKSGEKSDFGNFSYFTENFHIDFLWKHFKITKHNRGHILAQTACPGIFWFSQISGKVAKVPNLVGVIKLTFLQNGWSKWKSVWIFKETKELSMFHIEMVFWYFSPFIWQIAFEVSANEVHFLMAFCILRNISSLFFSGNILESSRIIPGTILWKLHVPQKSRSRVTGRKMPKFPGKFGKNLNFLCFLDLDRKFLHYFLLEPVWNCMKHNVWHNSVKTACLGIFSFRN